MLGVRPSSSPPIELVTLLRLNSVSCCTLKVLDISRLCMSLGSQNEVCDVVTLSKMEARRPVGERADGPADLKSSILHPQDK